jgi:hypothetical protein
MPTPVMTVFEEANIHLNRIRRQEAEDLIEIMLTPAATPGHVFVFRCQRPDAVKLAEALSQVTTRVEVPSIGPPADLFNRDGTRRNGG